ncbi:MAG: hypothetical protein ACQKBT_00620, partial [Puniceicoccales bacterium]
MNIPFPHLACLSSFPRHISKVFLRGLFCAGFFGVIAASGEGVEDLEISEAGLVSNQIPVTFTLEEAGEVTLVIEDDEGRRVRNLISSTWFDRGTHTVLWDGLDDWRREPAMLRAKRGIRYGLHGIYNVSGKAVPPGTYKIRGLVRDPLKLIYEFSPYTEATTPWIGSWRGSSRASTGTWLADHSPPADIAYIPPGDGLSDHGIPVPEGGQLMVVSPIAENGHGLVFLDTNGRKLFGQRTIGGNNYICGRLIARDAMESREDVYAYVGSYSRNELFLTAMRNEGNDRERETAVLSPRYKWDPIEEETELLHAVRGLAVHNGLMVVSLYHHDKLLLIDAVEGKVVGEFALSKPSGLAFNESGELLVLSENRLGKYQVSWQGPGSENVELHLDEVLAEEGILDDPQQLLIDSENGDIYISQWGNSNQIQVIDSTGSPLRTIGIPGPQALGEYDPLHMNSPFGMTFTPDGRLWVAEFDRAPRRLSVWGKDGTFVEAFYGSTRYGGGGTIDPDQPEKFYLGDTGGRSNAGLKFELDWKTGDAELEAVYARYETETFNGWFLESAPETPLHVGGYTYLTNTFSMMPTIGSILCGIWRLDSDGIARPVALFGNPRNWDALKNEEFYSEYPHDARDQSSLPNVFIWSDLNGDTNPQADEVQFGKIEGSTRIFTLQQNLDVITQGLRLFPVDRINENGVPVYDLSASRIVSSIPEEDQVELPETSILWSGNTGQAFRTGEDEYLLTGGPIRGFRNGEQVWHYPSRWPSLHASHFAPKPTKPGQMIGTTRTLGWPFTMPEGEAGEIWAINGNMGNIYLLTIDGLFLGELGADVRLNPRIGTNEETQVAYRGMSADSISFNDEHFYPSFGLGMGEKPYLVAGKQFAGIFRVEGLESVRRFEAPDLEISESQSEMIQMNELERYVPSGDRVSIDVAVTRWNPGIALDGSLEDWQDATWVQIDDEVSVAMKTDSRTFYFAFRSEDPELIENLANVRERLFLSGGGLDIMIGPNFNAPANRSEA